MPRFRRRRGQIAAELEEGLALLESAVRVRVKNHVIVDILTNDGRVDPDTWTAMATRAYLELSEQASQAAEHARRRARRAWSLTAAAHLHDYGAVDRRNLRRRAETGRLLSAQLLRRAHDPFELASITDTARQDAWEELHRLLPTLLDDDRVEDRAIVEERLGALQAGHEDPPATRR